MQRRRRALYLAAGLCARCKGFPVKGTTLCEKHAAVNRESVDRVRVRRLSAGLCEKYDRPAIEGRTRCTFHRDRRSPGRLMKEAQP